MCRLASLPTGTASPLARLGTTHLARCVVISWLPFEGVPARADSLNSAYLLFCSNFDGELDDYLDALATIVPETVTSVWQHCVDFPGVASRTAFHAYMKGCQIETTFLFGAYPSTSVATVQNALKIKKRPSPLLPLPTRDNRLRPCSVRFAVSSRRWLLVRRRRINRSDIGKRLTCVQHGAGHSAP